MFVKRSLYIANNKYYVVVTTTPNELEESQIEKFGEPSIDVGGTFIGPPQFVKPNQYKKLVTGFQPFTFTEDGNSVPNAKDVATAWSEEMYTRIAAAAGALRNLVDDYTNEREDTV